MSRPDRRWSTDLAADPLVTCDHEPLSLAQPGCFFARLADYGHPNNHGALDRIAAAVDRGIDILDQNAPMGLIDDGRDTHVCCHSPPTS